MYKRSCTNKSLFFTAMIKFSYSLFTFFLAVYSVFGEDNDHSDRSIFASIRRAEYGAENTYHFWRVSSYKPVTDPTMYKEGYNDNSKMIVGFNNMVVFANFENNKDYVIRVNQGLNEDVNNIPKKFLQNSDNDSLFDVITLKPTTTTTATTSFPDFIKKLQRETLPGYDPDKQSLNEYMYQIAANMSKMAQATDAEFKATT